MLSPAPGLTGRVFDIVDLERETQAAAFWRWPYGSSKWRWRICGLLKTPWIPVGFRPGWC